MEESSSKNMLSGYAYYLADRHLLETQVALDSLKQASAEKISYTEYLIKKKLLLESEVAKSTAEYFGLPLCDVNAFHRDLIPPEYLNIHLVRKRQALPLFKKNGLLYLAITDPTIEHLYELKFLTGMDTRFLVTEVSKLNHLIDDLLNTLILSEMDADNLEPLNTIAVHSYGEENQDLEKYDADSAPVVNYVNKVLLEAIEKKASDIHFEHYENSYRIRYRQHGILYPINSPPLKLANYLLARIKVMSELDITEHRIPQDGRFKLILSKNKSVDFRVNVCPTLFGEKVVLRILDTANTLQGIDELGMEPNQKEHLLNALQNSQGMILVTGPTGSGKTVTLYTSLHFLNSSEKNISTAEDPVEIPVLGINQVNVNSKVGLTFAAALKSFLRQDPDIIMVGEIRDLETGEIAVKAAQTGHLVLSTLHTNSAPETIMRLVNMGIPPYNIANSLKIVVAQRLLRVLCERCKTVEKIPEDILLKEGFKPEELGSFEVYSPRGCDYCTHGFKGRSGIFEVMPISPEMGQLIMEGGKSFDILAQAQREGITNLRESGLKKVKLGITSLAELNRVFK